MNGWAVVQNAKAFILFVKERENKSGEKKKNIFRTPAQHAEYSVVLFATKHPNNLVVNMDSFRQHPAKRCAEKVMRCYGYDPASQLKEQHNFSQTYDLRQSRSI